MGVFTLKLKNGLSRVLKLFTWTPEIRLLIRLQSGLFSGRSKKKNFSYGHLIDPGENMRYLFMLLDALQINETVRNARGLCVWNIQERVGKEIRKCFGKRFCSYNLLITKKKLRTECGKVDGCLFWSSDYQTWVINNLCWPNSLQHSNLPLLAIGLHHFELLFLSQVTYSQVLSIC